MRKTLLVGATALALVATQVSQAEEQAGNTIWSGFTDFFNPNWQQDFSATLGVKIWLNEWRRDAFFTDLVFTNGLTIINEDSKPRAETSDLETTPIPQLGLRYKWLFVTGSYYSKTDFDFEPTERTQTITDPGPPEQIQILVLSL